MICVGCLQPDLVLMSQSLLPVKITIVEVSRLLLQASARMLLQASTNKDASVQSCTTPGSAAGISQRRQVGILPWKVDVSGLLDIDTITRCHCCLEFLQVQVQVEIPPVRQRGRMITEDTATGKESVKAFYSLHSARCKALKMGSTVLLAADHISQSRSIASQT